MERCLFIVPWVVALMFSGCGHSKHSPQTANTPAAPFPHSMKGYELYSWTVGSEWYFTLMTGTNRLKAYDEITSGENTVSEDGWVKVTVAGVDSIKAVLGQVPAGEQVIWMGKERLEQVQGIEGDLTLPGREIVDEIEWYCEESGIELHVVD